MLEDIALTPEKIQDILTYAQLAMLVKRGGTMTDEEVMVSLRKKLDMTHTEIIAVAQTLAK